MTEPAHTEDVSPSCKCWVIGPTDRCPVHLYDRSETTARADRLKKPERVVNTTSSLRRR